MRITELRLRLREAFADADTYSRDIVHAELGGLTVNEALIAGHEPQDIWRGVVAHNPDLPPRVR
jgi:Protein of unknown function (DUF3046)